MDASSFEIGQVVEVDPDDKYYDRDWSLRSRLGEVIGVDSTRGEESVQVSLGINFTDNDLYERLTDGIGWFMPSELEIQKGGWTLEARADFIFSLGVWAVIPLGFPWSPDNRCMHEDHTDADAPLAVDRAMVNVHGTVKQIDVCEEHLDCDGRCSDDVPYREPIPLTA